MVAGKSPESLPAGWTVQVKVKNGRKFECYYNVETGQKFNSKNDFMRYVKAKNVGTPELTSKQNKSHSEKKPTSKRNKKHSERKPISKPDERHSERKTTQPTTETTEVPEWLPEGWTMRVKTRNSPTRKKYKIYSNVETGKKFYTKNEVMLYVKTGNVRTRLQRTLASNRGKTHSERKTKQIVTKKNDVPEWLPNGWTMELRTRNRGVRSGQKYKCYIDPETGHKFYTKPEVFQFLQALGRDSCTSKQKHISNGSDGKHCIDKTTGSEASLTLELSPNLKTSMVKPCTSKEKKVNIYKLSARKVVIERVKTPDELPPGWIKEIKIQKKASGIRKDPYYTDPVSGYIFRSTKDALRYLETGDINKCAIRPQKRDVNNLALKTDETPIQSPDNTQNSMHHTTRRQLFSGIEIRKASDLVAPVTGGSKTRQAKKVKVLEDKLLVDNVTEKCTEVQESSEPSGSALEAKGTKRKRGKTQVKEISQPSGSALEVTKGTKHKQGMTEAKEISKPSSSALEETKGVKRKRGKTVLAKHRPHSTPATDILQDDKLPNNKNKNPGNKKTKTNPRKPKYENALTSPSRSSKRLLGLTAELAAGLGVSERVLRDATKKSSGSSEASGTVNNLLDTTIHIANHASTDIEHPKETGAVDTTLPIANHASSDIEHSKESGAVDTTLHIANHALSDMEHSNEAGVVDTTLHIANHASSDVDHSNKTGVVDTTLHIANRASSDVEHSNRTGVVDTTLYIANHASSDVEHSNKTSVVDTTLHIANHASSDIEHSNKTDKPLNNQTVPQEPPRTEGPEQKDDENTSTDPNLFSQLGNCWSDPCLEFAYKTLTGAIPFEDNLPILPQEDETAHTQRDDSSSAADFGLHSFFQDDLPSHTTDVPSQPANVQQFPLNPAFLPTGNFNSPSCGNAGPQNPSFEGK